LFQGNPLHSRGHNMSSEQIHFERIRNEIIEQTSNRLVQVLFIKIFYHHVKKSAYLEGIKFSRNI
jgi:hypothetical protein